MSSDFCIKCDGGLSLYCGKCVDALRDELDVLTDKVIRLKAERDEALKRNASLEALHYESIKAERIAYAELREENDRLMTERNEALAERDDYYKEIERLHARIESINAAHVAAIALMKEVK